MKIRLHEIKDAGLIVTGSEPGHVLGLEDAPEVGLVEDIDYDLNAQLASEKLIVSGSVSADMELECSRCGVFFSTNCGNSAFLRAYRIEPGSDEVDITDDLREAVLLGMPSFPVCGLECRGLCPVCGKDMNRETCDCDTEKRDNRWNALDGLDL